MGPSEFGSRMRTAARMQGLAGAAPRAPAGCGVRSVAALAVSFRASLKAPSARPRLQVHEGRHHRHLRGCGGSPRVRRVSRGRAEMLNECVPPCTGRLLLLYCSHCGAAYDAGATAAGAVAAAALPSRPQLRAAAMCCVRGRPHHERCAGCAAFPNPLVGFLFWTGFALSLIFALIGIIFLARRL